MKKLICGLAVVLVFASALSGCTSSDNPAVPADSLTNPVANAACGSSSTHLWGIYDVTIDFESMEATAVANRNAMFTANCVNFLNSRPTGLTFRIISTPVGPDYIDVDIVVAITHPFPGLTQYNGYDVRGVFMGNGSGRMQYNSDLIYPVDGIDQSMLPPPDDGFDGPDGYSRWFNYTEFYPTSMPLFGYTQGRLASPGFAGTATICPYKYFADGLGDVENLWRWLEDDPGRAGQFSSGATNDRRYYLRFPTPTPNVTFGYAVVANWNGIEPEYHPANAPEAVACEVDDDSDVYYVDSGINGGNLNLDISVWDWDSTISGGMMEDYSIFIESTVLSAPYQLDSSEMAPIGGNEYYSTYHVEIPADNVTGVDDNEYWVIVECADEDYSNEFNVMNDAWTDKLAAFFRYDLYVSPSLEGPICDIVLAPDNLPMPYEGWAVEWGFDASGSHDPGGSALTFEWDFDNDGVFGDPYDSGTDEHPFKVFDFTNREEVCVRVTNEGGQSSECCVDVDIIGHPAKNIPLREGHAVWDIALDQNTGRLLVLYDDVTVWRYLLEDYYASPDPDGDYYDTHWDLMNPWPGHDFYIDRGYLDIMDNGYFVVNFGWHPGYWVDRAWYDVVDTDANQIVRQSPHANWSVSYGTNDIMAWGEDGTRDNDVAMLWGTSVPGSFNYVSTGRAALNWATEVYYSNWYQEATYRYGYEWYMGVWIRGAEVDWDDESFWTVERNDFYAARFHLELPGFNNDGIVYDDAYFGTGAATDSDDGFYDPRDLTRDTTNVIMVLDWLSDETCRLKGYDVSEMPVESLGGMDLDELIGPARRIDCGDFVDPLYGNYLIVLHGDDTEGYYVSVYFPDELPW